MCKRCSSSNICLETYICNTILISKATKYSNTKLSNHWKKVKFFTFPSISDKFPLILVLYMLMSIGDVLSYSCLFFSFLRCVKVFSGEKIKVIVKHAAFFSAGILTEKTQTSTLSSKATVTSKRCIM